MSLLDERELAHQILGAFYRVATQTKDRTPGAPINVDGFFGVPEDSTELEARATAFAGKRLALDLYIVPKNFAKAFLCRQVGKELVALYAIPPAEWDEDEKGCVDEMEYRIKRLVHKLSESKQWFDLQPQGGNPYDPEERLDLGHDTMTMAFKIKPAGLEAAFRLIPGTKYEQGPKSVRDRVGEKWQDAPQWLKDEAK